MSKINASIEIVISNNKRLSSMSLSSRMEIKSVLEKRYSDVRISEVSDRDALDGVIARQPDLVFLGMKFIPGCSYSALGHEWMSQCLQDAGIAYTGSGMAAAVLEHNKHKAKHRVRKHGLATAESIVLAQGQEYTEADITMNYPIFIKPVDGGGGSGINEGSLVHSFVELKNQVSWLLSRIRSGALLETYLPGREFSVGILRDTQSDTFHAMPLEIVAPLNQVGSRFLSSSVKQADSEQTLEVTDHILKDKLRTFALDAFNALGAEDYGRIDIRLDAAGELHFLEANLLPSLLDNYGNLPKAALMNIGLGHSALVLQIAELGWEKLNQWPEFTEEPTGYSLGPVLQPIVT